MVALVASACVADKDADDGATSVAEDSSGPGSTSSAESTATTIEPPGTSSVGESGTDTADCAPVGAPPEPACCSGIAIDGQCCANFEQACSAGECCFGECDAVTGLCPAAPDCGAVDEPCLEQPCCDGLVCADGSCMLGCAGLGERCVEQGCCGGLTCDGESSTCTTGLRCAVAEGDWCGADYDCCADQPLYCDLRTSSCQLQPD